MPGTALLVTACLLQLRPVGADDRPKIAIVGGGIGGTACAYFLRSALGPRADIDLFEQRPIVGGRLATVDIAGQRYEAGGSVIHKRNKYMSQFVEQFGLKKRGSDSSGGEDSMGILDGRGYAFRGSSWSVITALKVLWRYGMDIFRAERVLDAMLDRFDRVYQYQKEGGTFSTVRELLEAIGPDAVGSLDEHLAGRGLSPRFVREVAGAAVRVNYGQNVSVPAFVGAVALAGVQKGLWSVESGNRLVAEALLANSSASLRHCSVRTVSRLGDTFGIDCVSGTFLGYQAVVLAVPLIEGTTQLSFDGFLMPSANYGPYHRLYVTFVRGALKADALGACERSMLGGACPTEILVCCDDQIWFNSVGPQRPVDSGATGPAKDGRRTWKVMSNGRLTESDLHILFESVTEWRAVDWLAYPRYTPGEGALARFDPVRGIYHINAVEWAASAMEMSAIGAANVALMVARQVDRKGVDGKRWGLETVDRVEL